MVFADSTPIGGLMRFPESMRDMLDDPPMISVWDPFRRRHGLRILVRGLPTHSAEELAAVGL